MAELKCIFISSRVFKNPPFLQKLSKNELFQGDKEISFPLESSRLKDLNKIIVKIIF